MYLNKRDNKIWDLPNQTGEGIQKYLTFSKEKYVLKKKCYFCLELIMSRPTFSRNKHNKIIFYLS